MQKELIQKLIFYLCFMNKYLITIFLFGIWMLFIHEYNLLFFSKKVGEKSELEYQKEFYKNEIEQDSIELYKIQNIQEEQERFARERFLMKKEKEEIFIIREKKDE